MQKTSRLSAYLLVLSALPLMVFGFARSASARDGLGPAARAQTQGGVPIVVDSLADNASANDGEGTLREAIENANTNLDSTDGDCAVGQAAEFDTIAFEISGTITLGSALPAITGTLAISGGNAITLSGNNSLTVLTVETGVALRVDGLTIADGRSAAFGDGGAINNAGCPNCHQRVVYQ